MKANQILQELLVIQKLNIQKIICYSCNRSCAKKSHDKYYNFEKSLPISEVKIAFNIFFIFAKFVLLRT